MEMVLMLRA